MKKGIAVALIVGAVQVFGTVTAFASTNTGYNPNSDTTVNVGSGGGTTTQTALSSTTFQTQEGLYQALGLQIPHDYIWVSVGGQSILALDPPHPMM